MALTEKYAWETEDLIWSVLPDCAAESLVLEIRNTTSKLLNFIALDIHSGQMIFDGFDIDLPWWSRPRYAFKHQILLEDFANPDIPEARGLSVWHMESNKLSWENPFLRFVTAKKDVLICETQQAQQINISLNNGEPTDEEQANATFALQYPIWLEPEFRSYEGIAAFLQTKGGFEQVRQIQYGETGNLMLVLFEANSSTENKFLWLMRPDGELVLEKKWASEHNSKPVIQFFWTENTLFVLENKHLLTAYELD
jgi:hypothetical protein